MNKAYCQKDEKFITPELLELWGDVYGTIRYYGSTSFGVYIYASDPDYYNDRGSAPPHVDDILCVISYDKSEAAYFLYKKGCLETNSYRALKDYVAALKNIAFL